MGRNHHENYDYYLNGHLDFEYFNNKILEFIKSNKFDPIKYAKYRYTLCKYQDLCNKALKEPKALTIYRDYYRFGYTFYKDNLYYQNNRQRFYKQFHREFSRTLSKLDNFAYLSCGGKNDY